MKLLDTIIVLQWNPLNGCFNHSLINHSIIEKTKLSFSLILAIRPSLTRTTSLVERTVLFNHYYLIGLLIGNRFFFYRLAPHDRPSVRITNFSNSEILNQKKNLSSKTRCYHQESFPRASKVLLSQP